MLYKMADLILNYKYLSAKSLSGFDKYKYKSVDTSPLSNYVMHPFWDRLVKIFPLWVPANLLTLVGWLLSLFVFIGSSYFDLHYISSSKEDQQTVPNWFWICSAFCTFWAHQLDGCDGKQARRTNSSSPLGELFDHGLDSTAVWLMAMSLLSVFGISNTTVTKWEFVFVIYFTLFAFYIAHWEKYTTSVLFLPWAYDISQIVLTTGYLGAYIFGISIWKTTFLDGALNIPHIFKACLFVIVIFVCVPFSLFNQYRARRDYPADCVSVMEGMQPLVSLGSVTIIHMLYGYLSIENIVDSQLRLYLVCYGLLYANINCRLIVAQMSGEVCERFNSLAWPLFGVIIIGRLQIVDEQYVLICYVIFLILAHLHYGVNVVRQLSDHLNVYCFKVGKRPRKVRMESEVNGCSNGFSKQIN